LNTLTQTLASLSRSLPGLLPELTLAGLFVLIILVDLVGHRRPGKPLTVLTLVGLAMTGYLVYRQAAFLQNAPMLFFGLLCPDGLAVYLKALIGLAAGLTLLLALAYPEERHRTNQAEWLAPFVALVLGTYLLVMSTNLLMLYLALELVSLASYVLTAYNGNRPAAEGGMKYLLFGAMSSAVMLYGMSWLYGFTGSLNFTDPTFYAGLGGVPPLPLLVAVFLTLSGLLFKVAAVPFHVWVPDTYQAAPLPVAAFFSIAPKAAGLGVLLRVVEHLRPEGADNLTGLATSLPVGLSLVVLLTLTMGNFAALWQGNARRLLAYSSVAHAGFLLIGVVAGNAAGTESMLFYLGVYLFMNLAAFLLVAILAQRAGSEQVSSFSGLGIRLPLVGVVAVVIMVALAGLPPTAGFTAKLLLFSSLWQAYDESSNGWLLAVFAVGLLNVAVSLFYYLKIPFYLFFRPLNELNAPRLGMYEGALLLLLALPVVGLFFVPDWLYRVITTITK
jgi:NADH-quinone oxidoreductase subunit N